MTSLATRARLARVEADLAEARLREDGLQYAYFEASRTGEGRSPEAIEVDLLRQQATIAELEAAREELLGAPAPPVPAPTPAATPGVPEYASTAEAANLLGMSARTLEGLRARGQGPAHIRIGRRVLYPLATLRDPPK